MSRFANRTDRMTPCAQILLHRPSGESATEDLPTSAVFARLRLLHHRFRRTVQAPCADPLFRKSIGSMLRSPADLFAFRPGGRILQGAQDDLKCRTNLLAGLLAIYATAGVGSRERRPVHHCSKYGAPATDRPITFDVIAGHQDRLEHAIMRLFACYSTLFDQLPIILPLNCACLRENGTLHLPAPCAIKL